MLRTLNEDGCGSVVDIRPQTNIKGEPVVTSPGVEPAGERHGHLNPRQHNLGGVQSGARRGLWENRHVRRDAQCLLSPSDAVDSRPCCAPASAVTDIRPTGPTNG